MEQGYAHFRTGTARSGYPEAGGVRMGQGAAGDRRLRKDLCAHAARRVVVHAVSDGHRAHCLRCGTLGPVRERPEVALRAIVAGREERPGDVRPGLAEEES